METETHLVNSRLAVSSKSMLVPGTALPRDCSIDVDAAPSLDTVLFRGSATSIGQFRCPIDRAAFRDSGPIKQSIVVFPRTSVWIQHDASRAFVADPTVVTIYNRGQRYERRAISPEGDRCDWFAVSDEVAREIVRAYDANTADSGLPPFRFAHVPSTAELYLAQRRVVRSAGNGRPDVMQMEERTIGIVAQVVGLAYQQRPVPLVRRASAARHRADLTEAAKAELSRCPAADASVSEIARALNTSVFHLCRIFRAHTGFSMHEYRTQVRVRAALELLGGDGAQVTLSGVAHEFGFASHAHLVRISRRYFGASPSELRGTLRAQ